MLVYLIHLETTHILSKMNKDNILILGNGFLGKEFVRHGYKNFTQRKQSVLGKPGYFNVPQDVSDVHYFLDRTINQFKVAGNEIKTIINAIGIANTRYCEDRKNFNEIKRINGDFVGVLSRYCKERNIKLVHISTGCLYDDRSKGTSSEDDLIAAHCNYVVSKWIGEMGCDLDRDLIIRPRLYFSDIENSLNLICKFKKFDKILNEFNSVTSTRTIVEAVTALLENNQSGIFNVANDGAYTIKQLSEAIGYNWRKDQVVKQEELHKSQGLYLVNNVMDLTKLKQFYTPRDAIEEIKELNKNLHHD